MALQTARSRCLRVTHGVETKERAAAASSSVLNQRGSTAGEHQDHLRQLPAQVSASGVLFAETENCEFLLILWFLCCCFYLRFYLLFMNILQLSIYHLLIHLSESFYMYMSRWWISCWLKWHDMTGSMWHLTWSTKRSKTSWRWLEASMPLCQRGIPDTRKGW